MTYLYFPSIKILESYIVWLFAFLFRRYTRYYGTSERAAKDLVHDALTSNDSSFVVSLLDVEINLINCFIYLQFVCYILKLWLDYKRWEEDIEKWQNPILKNDKLPEWWVLTSFKPLLYFFAYYVNRNCQNSRTSQSNHYHFMYAEGHPNTISCILFYYDWLFH